MTDKFEPLQLLSPGVGLREYPVKGPITRSIDTNVIYFYDRNGHTTLAATEPISAELITKLPEVKLRPGVALCSHVLAHLSCTQSVGAQNNSPALCCLAPAIIHTSCKYRDVGGARHKAEGIQPELVSVEPHDAPAYRKKFARTSHDRRKEALTQLSSANNSKQDSPKVNHNDYD